MIDKERLAALRVAMAGGGVDVADSPLADLPHDELRALRAEIDRVLPPNTMDSLNLESELVEQFLQVKGLQTKALNDANIPLNQRSQLAGQVAGTLAQLVKMQIDLQRDERLKKIELALVEAVQTLADDAKDRFFVEYEKIAQRVGAAP